MGACASVHKDPGYPKEQFLDSPTKAEAANEKGGCGGGDDDFADFKSKVDAEQQRAELNPKSPDSGTRDGWVFVFFWSFSEVMFRFYLL